jgi:hypothetical protein
MVRQVTVMLAGREYVVTELPLRRNAEWRQSLSGLAEGLTMLLDAPGLQFTPGVVAQLARQIVALLLETPAELLRLLYTYSPAIAADRERIEAEGFDSEVMAAFTEVLQLAFPFGSLMKSVRALTTGSAMPVITPSSPAPSGESGTMS